MLDLEKLGRKIDFALSQETEESLTAWLLSVRIKELFSQNRPFNIKMMNWAGVLNDNLELSNPLTALNNPSIIFGNEDIRGPLSFNSTHDIPSGWRKRETKNIDTTKKMTPDFMGSFFLYKIAS